MRGQLLYGLAACLLAASPAFAIRPFTLVEDGYPEAKGQLELENTVEVNWHSREEQGFKEFSVEHELEYGLTNNLTLRAKGSYLYTDSHDFRGLTFDAAGVEAQYFFTNPNIDPVGISLIGSALITDRKGFATEDFLVVQKDFDKWVVAYNLGVATEVERFFGGGRKETTGTLINSAAAVYNVNPRLRVGIEGSVESEYAEWRKYTGSTAYAGPVVNITPTDDLWITIGFDFNLTGHRDEPQYRFALIVGYYF